MLKLDAGLKAQAYGLSEEYHFTQAEWLKMVSVAKERGTLDRFCKWQKGKFILIQTSENERLEVLNGESQQASSN